jgi:hypothetical protein
MDITSIKTSKTVDGQAATIVEAAFTSPRFDAARWGGGDTILTEDIRRGRTFWAVRLDGKSFAGGKRFAARADAERWLAKNADPARGDPIRKTDIKETRTMTRDALDSCEDALHAAEDAARAARVQRLDSLEDLLRLAAASAVAKVDAGSCGTARDWTKAAKAEEEFQVALEVFREAL